MKILIAEDELKTADYLRKGLGEQGCAVDVAHNGIDGQHLALEHDYDVIVLDAMLPGMDGFAVLRSLRSVRQTPVIMLTARDGVEDRIRGLHDGADDYLVKPFSFVVLEARLRALVRRGAPERPATFEAGDLVVDPAAREVRRGDTRISVTAREYAVLEYLIRNRNQVVSKAQIMRAVWDSAYDGDDNIVEVYVGYLRRKIDTPFGAHAIETVRGQGYRLVDSEVTPSGTVPRGT